MAHLKKSATTGHLLRGSGGHLVNGECGCPDALDITFVGVDASACATCHEFGSANPLFRTALLTVDGTYTVPFLQEFAGNCIYGWSLDASTGNTSFAGDAVQRKYLDTSPSPLCVNENTFQSPATSVDGNIRIHYRRSDSKIVRIDFRLFMDVLQFNPSKEAPVFLANPEISLSDPAANELECGDRTLAGGGQATVVITP